jgi:hypothetical protein
MLVVNPSQQMREWLWGTTSCWWPLVVSRANSLCPAAIFPTCSPFAPSRFVCRDCCDTCVSAFGQRPCACGVVTLQDAQNIVAALPGVSNVVVVGTSFIGVESAAGIRGKNDVRPLLRCVSCPFILLTWCFCVLSISLCLLWAVFWCAVVSTPSGYWRDVGWDRIRAI